MILIGDHIPKSDAHRGNGIDDGFFNLDTRRLPDLGGKSTVQPPLGKRKIQIQFDQKICSPVFRGHPLNGKRDMLESPLIQALIKNLLIGLGFIGLILLVIRPMLKTLRTVLPPKFEPIETAEDEVRRLMEAKQIELAQAGQSQKALIEKVRNESYETAQVLKSWVDGKSEA